MHDAQPGNVFSQTTPHPGGCGPAASTLFSRQQLPAGPRIPPPGNRVLHFGLAEKFWHKAQKSQNALFLIFFLFGVFTSKFWLIYPTQLDLDFSACLWGTGQGQPGSCWYPPPDPPPL